MSPVNLRALWLFQCSDAGNKVAPPPPIKMEWRADAFDHKTANLAQTPPGKGRGHCPPKPQVICFTNVILHSCVLFCKLTDITVMFVSRDSPTSRGLFRHLHLGLMRLHAICCPHDDDRGSAGGVHPSATPSPLHSKTGCHCGKLRFVF